ncbi:MAG: FHA domain-containing protein [Christensenellales bacterium]
MNDTAYNVASAVLKYWFLLLIAYIFIRITQMLISEFREFKRGERDIYFAYCGYLEVCQSADAHSVGARFPFRRATYAGSSVRCDIRLKSRSLSPREFVIYQHGHYFYAGNVSSKHGVLLDGTPLEQEDLPVKEGSVIEVRGFSLEVHFMREKNV